MTKGRHIARRIPYGMNKGKRKAKQGIERHEARSRHKGNEGKNRHEGMKRGKRREDETVKYGIQNVVANSKKTC
jgi:hypothetical protein